MTSDTATRTSLTRLPGQEGPRRSLVLAGSGMRVAYQAGALQALVEAGLGFEHADGTSGGAMNLAMLLSGVSPAQMCDRWRSLSERDLFSSMSALLARLGIDVRRINAQRGMLGTFNIGNLSTKQNLVVSHHELSDELLLAAISPPGLVPPVHIAGSDYGDAVWIQNANLLEAVRRGAEEVWLVWCLGHSSRQRVGAMPSYDQLLEMAASGGLSVALSYVAELNERILGGDSPWGQRAPVRLKVIKPEYPLPLDVADERAGIDGTTLVHLGYADAWRRLAAREVDDALDVAALRMQSGELAVALNERFGGFLSAEPVFVAREKLDTPVLSVDLWLSIFVYELTPFISEPSLGAPLAGTVRWGGVSLGLRGGVVRSETDPVTHARRLVYEACFQPRGKERLLRLRLERKLPGVGPMAPREVATLRDVTTLRAFVHDGLDAKAPIIARGEVETSVEDLTASCRTLQAIEPGSPRDGARAIVQLGRFLFGDLYDAYTGRPWWKVW